MIRRRSLWFWLAGALVAAAPVSAGPVQIQDGKFQAEVSSKAESRISILGERIVKVRKLDDPDGPKILVDADDTTGDVFVGFDGDVSGKTFSIFLTTSRGHTYQATLSPRLIEAQTVLVRPDPSAVSVTPDEEGDDRGGAPAEDGGSGRHEAYTEVLTNFIRAMFNDLQAPGIERRAVRDVSRQAGPFQMREIYTYRVAGLKGTVIELRNTSLIGQSLNSKSFLVPGLLAAAVSHEMVQPQQAGRVYLVEAAK